MSQVLQISKNNIINAINLIEQNSILRVGRESHEYDLVYEGNRYPPILVLSEANKIVGGNELTINDYGNSTRKAFRILKKYGFQILKKEPQMNKEGVLEIVNLCQLMVDGRRDGSITTSTYTEKFRPHLDKFEEQYGTSPNIYLQDELKKIYSSSISKASPHFKCKNFGYWGRSIYNYTWSCVFYDFELGEIPASYSPQLYILINKEGIKFGFCFGHHINENNNLNSSILSANQLSTLKKCFEVDKDLLFFNSTNDEVTARPENLFGKEERILIKSDSDIISNWSSNSLLIKEFNKENIPENISEIIQKTLKNLENFFLSLLPINTKKVMEIKLNEIAVSQFELSSVYSIFKKHGLHLNKNIITRFVSSLLCKPFVILTGLSGSGKTKLAQAFAMWICEDENQYCMVPVGADWTNREPLLGFSNALDNGNYVLPENGVLSLILDASKESNSKRPFFLILDEMNLSHVERYFADFLSIMESKDGKGILLHSDNKRIDSNDNIIPQRLKFPSNLFIIGTVNIDETTYMFSPKVLDRASVIEFRVAYDEMEMYLESNPIMKIKDLEGKGKDEALSFVAIAKDENLVAKDAKKLNKTLMSFFSELKKTGAEFGYRSASEILRFAAIVNKLDPDWDQDQIIDAAIMQKLLPKLHGSRKKLSSVLIILCKLCIDNGIANFKDKDELFLETYFSTEKEITVDNATKIVYPLSFEKLVRMYHNLINNGFTSYAEAN